MEDLTFGEQVKIVLGRKGMTIKELAETIEKETGKKMSRQNLTQRLGRDNFQEQDMRLIASILGCPFQLSIMSGEITESAAGRIRKQEVKWNEQEQPEENFSEETVETEKEEQQLTGEERDMTIGEIYDMHEELAELEKNAVEAEPTEDVREDLQTEEEEYKEELQEVPKSDQEEENSAESENSYTEDYAQPAEEEAEPYEEAELHPMRHSRQSRCRKRQHTKSLYRKRLETLIHTQEENMNPTAYVCIRKELDMCRFMTVQTINGQI